MNRRTRAARIHIITVAANRLEQEHANPALIKDLRKLAAGVEYSGHLTAEDEKRIERQRTLFTMLGDTRAIEAFKQAILQRAYDLLWEGDARACDELCHFVPEHDATAMLDAWSNDQDGKEPKSEWH